MCQVYIEPPNRKSALLLLWHATSGRLFLTPIPGEFSNVTPQNVDLSIGDHTIEEVETLLVKLGLGEMPVYRIPDGRVYPDPETVRDRVLLELKARYGHEHAA